MKTYYVYIMAIHRNGTLYTGVTSDLIKRVYQHRAGMTGGFTHKYGIKTLVWYETADSVISAIAKEKNIKAWKRKWKLELIEDKNPDWDDLWFEINGIEMLQKGSY